MMSGSPGVPVRAASLLVALATLLLPLGLLVVGVQSSPAPAPLVVALEPEPVPPLFAELPDVVAEQALPEPQSEPSPEPIPMPGSTQAFNPFPRWTREENTNVLLIGADRRDGDETYRTDTVILANVDFRSSHATLLSIPRDLVVNIPGYGHDRINTAYAVGESLHPNRPGAGLSLLRETVERNFGVEVHHYALVDFSCFRGAVDALGGVGITVPSRIYDPYYPTDDYGYKLVTFEPGYQWLDGERALQYVRTRYGDTDFGRMRRQQQMLSAVREQVLQVKSLAALPQAMRACSGMSSDLSVFDLVALGAGAREIRPANITFRVIDERLAVPYIAPSGASVLLPRWESIRPMVRVAFPSATARVGSVN